jgi:hypothetical protein
MTRALAGLILLVAAEAAAGEGATDGAGAVKAAADGAGAVKAAADGAGAGAKAAAPAPGSAAPAPGTGTGPAALEALVKAAPACEAARAHCVGIRLHVAVAADGGGLVAAPDWVALQVTTANRHFAPLGVGIQVVGAEALPEAAARIEDAQERSSLARLVAGTVIDVFVTAQLDDIDVKDHVIRGVAWPAAGKKFVIISTIAPDRVLAHEIGHVFGLPHSAYAISIMNKRQREQPPAEQRTFHPNELAIMREQLVRLLREKVIADLPRAARAPTAPAAPVPAAPATARP